jgi:hypothetical protein
MVLLILTTTAHVPSASAHLEPTYTVTVSMPETKVNPLWTSKVSLTFLVSGVGFFVNGSIEVRSDTINLLANTLTMKGFAKGADGLANWMNTSSPEKQDRKAMSAKQEFLGPAVYQERSTVKVE